MGFLKSMEEANYNFDAQKEGWIYGWTEKFITENIETMSVEVIQTAQTQLPPIEVYNNPTQQMKKEKKEAEQNLNQKIIMITNNKEKGRSIA